MKRIALVLACVLFVACQVDRRSPTGVHSPSAELRDGANGGPNLHFFFLPPLVKQPSFTGTFNPTLKPVVVICQLDVDVNNNNKPLGCSSAPPVVVLAADADLTGKQYMVNWNTGQPLIDPNKFYRIQVFGSRNGLLLGWADVDPVNNGSGLKNVNTGEYIGLVDGRKLPIQFRIERGAFGTNCERDCAEASVSNAGGTVITNTRFAGALFPNGWIRPDVVKLLGTDNVVVTIERVNVADLDGPCVPRDLPQAEGCYRFRTSPDVGLFNTDVTVGICVEVPESSPEHAAAQLFSVEEGEEAGTVTPLPNAAAPFVTCEGFASSRVGSPFASFARGLLHHVGSWLAPASAYAAHVGAGGLSGSFSRIGWVLPTDIDFDGVPSGTLINNQYNPQGVTFTRLSGEGESCAQGSSVFANSNGNTFTGNAVSVCSSGSAAFSENNDGVIEADFGAPVSTVCIDVDAVGPEATGFIEAFAEGEGIVSLGRTTSTSDAPQTICFQAARGVEISFVRFAGTGDGSAAFDNLSVTFIDPPSTSD